MPRSCASAFGFAQAVAGGEDAGAAMLPGTTLSVSASSDA
jgi:hypothetical protein